jgi:hypothetical protein
MEGEVSPEDMPAHFADHCPLRLLVLRYHGRTLAQIERLGASSDWDRVSYTMDSVSVLLYRPFTFAYRLLVSTCQKPSMKPFSGYTMQDGSIVPTDSSIGASS